MSVSRMSLSVAMPLMAPASSSAPLHQGFGRQRKSTPICKASRGIEFKDQQSGQPTFGAVRFCCKGALRSIFALYITQVSGVMRTPSRNGLKGQQALSPGHRPGYKDMGKLALKGHKLYLLPSAFALSGRPILCNTLTQGKLYLLPSAFALSGRPILCNTLTQGNTLGWELAGLSGRLQQNSRNFSI